MATLRIRLLGGFNLAYGETLLTSLDSPRVQLLLAYLLLHRDAPLARQQVAFLFFPDSPETQARTNLRNLLHLLRNGLPEADRFLSADSKTLQWNSDSPFALDVEEFESRVAPPTSAASLREAIELYRGELLPGRYDDWILPERERLHQQFLDALERLLLLLEDQREYRAAIGYAQHLLRTDPLREETYRHLMRLHALTGDRAGVVRFYNTCVAVLGRELAVEPGLETRQAYEECLQLEAPPVPPPPPARTSNLAIQLTSFVGRENQIVEVERLLASTRLLMIIGAGGVGKTRLALEVASRMATSFRDGAWLVDLAPISDPALVPQIVASALRVGERTGQSVMETVIENVREKDLLLVLDNCEHLVSACAHLAHGLLGASAHLRILATSRQALGIAGETAWRLPSLSVPPSGPRASTTRVEVSDLLEFESVKLFVERATAAMPTFVATQDNAQTLAEVCRALEGIPLAIELAAARLKVLSVEEIAARLDDRLTVLTHGSRGALPRHQTLRATLDWSHGLLSEPERIFFRRLAVFAGGFTLEAAETVCAFETIQAGQVLDLLSHLIDKSLCVVDEKSSEGTSRYRFLETIRQYAGRKLVESGEPERVRDRHLDFSLNLAEEAFPRLTGDQQTASWLNRLEIERENFRNALGWSLERGNTEAALRLAGALARFWDQRSYFAEGRGWLEKTLSAHRGTSPRLQARALRGLGRLVRLQGQYAEAHGHLEIALRLFRELDDRLEIAATLGTLAAMATYEGNYAEARLILEEQLAICREIGDRLGATSVLLSLGEAERAKGNLAEAGAFFSEALQLHRELGDETRVSITLNNSGYVALRRGDIAQAAAGFHEGLRIASRLRNLWVIAHHLAGMAAVAAESGNPQRAARLIGAAEALFGSLGSQLDTTDRIDSERFLGVARAQMDEASWQAAREEGRAMTLEEAIHQALG